MKLIIVEAPGRTIVAEVENYTGQIPHPGEYIAHPPLNPSASRLLAHEMCVLKVTYGILARPEHGGENFTGSPEPYVEIDV
jgi:hypothetical protein